MSTRPATDPSAPVTLALGNLRGLIVVMVVAQHAWLAYHPLAPAPQPTLAAHPRTWLTVPVVDTERSAAFVAPLAFNDVFGMALMFLLSGLFVRQSLQRKGPHAFLRDRVRRLGVPFAVSAIVLTPLAYYPSHLVTTRASGFGEAWLSMGIFPAGAGPAWFIWLLLAFDALAARGVELPSFLRRSVADASAAGLFVRLVIASVVVYVPVAAALGAGTWWEVGPFKVQVSRVLLYLLYFLTGVAIGTIGVARGLLSPSGSLARRHGAWCTTAAIAFLLVTLAQSVNAVLTGVLFAVSCAASSFAVLSLTLRHGARHSPLLASLRDNAYGIYLIHYVVVTWIQYALLSLRLSGLTKGLIAFTTATATSWVATATLRRLALAKRLL